MNQLTPASRHRNLRAFIAAFISYLMLVGQCAPLVLAAQPARAASQSESASPAKGGDVNAGGDAFAQSKRSVPITVSVPKPAPPATGGVTGGGGVQTSPAPNIVATKTDNRPAVDPATANPGDTIHYTVVISNTGTADASNVQFSDSVDNNTTLVANSGVLAADDDYNTIGNVNINVAAPGLLANDLDVDAGNNTGMTATAATESSANCTGGCTNNVTINTDGSFTYDPPVGFTGTDTFTYTANTSGGKTATATAHILVAGMIWFVKSGATTCTTLTAASGCGRLSHPFSSLASFQAVNDGNAGPPKHPAAGDSIFLFESGIGYTGPVTLLNNQKLIGQDATASLITITGLSQPSGTDPLPAMNSGNATIATINSSASNGVNLGQGNTVRGLTISGTTGAKISGSGFGTLLVGDSTTPDVSLSGGGQALTLTNGTLANTSGFVGVASTSSTATGVTLDNVSVASGGTVSFGSTSTASSTNEGILVKDCTTTNSCSGTISFGNTQVTGGTDGVSLTNNNAGTRSFGTLNVSGSSASAFKNVKGALANGGGNVTVTGTTTLSSAGSAVNVADMVASSSINFQSSVSATSTGSGNAGVSLSGSNGAGATLTFNSLTVQTNAGAGLNLAGGGTVNVTNGTGTVNNTTQAAPAIVANGIALNANFSAIKSSGGTNGVSLTSVTGTSDFGTGALSGASGATFLVDNGTCTVTYSGNITQANNAPVVSVSNGHNTGTITFQTGAISATNGTGLQFDNADGTYNFNGTNTLNGGDAGVDILDGSGGTFSFSSNTTITSPSGVAFNIDGTSAAVTAGVTYSGTITQNNAASAVSIKSKTGGTTAFGGAITASTGAANAIDMPSGNAGSTVNFTGGLSLTTTGGTGFNAAGGGTVNATQNNTSIINTISSTTGTALNVANTTIGASGLTFRSISATGSSNNSGIILDNTGATAGLTVTGNAGTCTVATPTCTGGTINSKTGSDINTLNTDGTANITGTNGVGIFLRSTKTPSFTLMHLHDFSNYAVIGSSVTGFSLTNSVIDGANGNNTADGEASIFFSNLSGTAAGSTAATISNSTIKGGWTDNIRVTDTNVTLELTVSSSTIRDTNTGTNGNDNLHIDARNTANVTAHVTNDTFAATNGDHLQTICTDTAHLTIVATGNTLSGGGGANALGQGITISGGSISGSTDSTEVVRFNISNNQMTGTIQGGSININEGAGNGDWQGQVSSNTVGTSGVLNSGCAQCSDIRVENHSKGTLTAIVNGNTLHQWSVEGITLSAGDQTATGLGNGPLNVTVTSNTVDTPNAGSAADHGIVLNGGTQIGNNNQICLDLKNNNSTGDVANGGVDYRPRQRMLTTVKLPGYTGANNNDAAVDAYVLARPNTASGSGTVAASDNVAGGGGGFVNTPGPGNPCTQPTVPTAPVTGGITPTTNGPTAKAGLTQRPLTAGVTARSFVSPIRSGVTGTAAPAVVARPLATASGVKGGTSRNITPTVRIIPGPLSGGTVSANIGTLHPGDSVTINFSVTVNNPYSGGPNVSNQGTVSGSNFSSVLTDDPDNPGGPGSPHATLTPVNVTNVAVNDAKAPEPPSGTTQMLFTLTLSQPAPNGGLTVSYATADQTPGAGHATGGASCDGTSDYVTASGTATVPQGSNVTTIPVTVCSDNVSGEPDETFLVNISSPSAGTITRAQATGTITQSNPAGTFIISELRTSGPGGAGDDFVELYNNTDTPLTVAASDASGGFGLFKQGADCNSTPVLIATIPNGTVIPARGHYLVVGSQYSLANYGGTGAAAGDQTMTADIENDKNVSVFSTANVANISSVNRLDAVGFGTNTGGVCDLLREGNTLPPVSGSTVEYSFFRTEGTTSGGNPKDTNDNSSDFRFADTQGTFISGVPQQLGAPGPENKTSPIRRDTSGIGLPLLDASVSSALPPNRVRDTSVHTDPNTETFGTLSIRRRVVNNTGGNVTRLRFRIVDMTTFPSPGGGVADLRAITSADVVGVSVNDPATCSPNPAPCTVTVKGTTLETPPAQTNGGGYNSTLSAGSVTLGTPLANGASVDLQFLLGVQTTGTFRFLIIIEALP